MIDVLSSDPGGDFAVVYKISTQETRNSVLIHYYFCQVYYIEIDALCHMTHVMLWSVFASGHVTSPGVGVTTRRGGEEATGRAQLINFPLSPRLEMQRMTQIRDRLPSLLAVGGSSLLCYNSLCSQ